MIARAATSTSSGVRNRLLLSLGGVFLEGVQGKGIRSIKSVLEISRRKPPCRYSSSCWQLCVHSGFWPVLDKGEETLSVTSGGFYLLFTVDRRRRDVIRLHQLLTTTQLYLLPFVFCTHSINQWIKLRKTNRPSAVLTRCRDSGFPKSAFVVRSLLHRQTERERERSIVQLLRRRLRVSIF